MLVEDPVPACERLRCIGVGIPDVGRLRHDPECPLLPTATDHERQARLEGRRIVPCTLGREPRPVERDGLAIEQAAADVRRLREPVDPLPERRERPTERPVLRPEPAPSQSERGAAPRRVVEGGGHLHEETRVPIARARDQATHPSLARATSPAEQDRPPLEYRPDETAVSAIGPRGERQEVIVAPELIEAERVDVGTDRHQVVPGHVLTPHLETDPETTVTHRSDRRGADDRARA